MYFVLKERREELERREKEEEEREKEETRREEEFSKVSEKPSMLLIIDMPSTVGLIGAAREL